MRATLLAIACAAAALLSGCGPAVFDSPSALMPVAGWKGADVNSADGFRFVVLSDRTGGHEKGAWARAVAEVNRLRPDFVMCVGDLIEGYTDDVDAIAEQWKQFDELTRGLKAPFFYCTGNHDVAYGATRQAYAARRPHRGRTYYSFDFRGCHFAVIDTTAVVNSVQSVADAQWAWLAKDLKAAAGARHVFLFMHHPLFGTRHWRRIRRLLTPAKTTVFAGHWHTLSYDTEDDVPYYVLGRTAAKTKPDIPREKGAFQMFAHVAVSKGQPAVSILPLGQVLPGNFISRALSKRVRLLAAAATLSTVTRAGGDCMLRITNPTDTDASFALKWAGEAKFFAAGLPKTEILPVSAGQAVTRTYRVAATGPALDPPKLEIEYSLTHDGQTGRGKRTLMLPVAAELAARRVRAVKIDGKLDDWPGGPAGVAKDRTRVRDNPATWTGPADCTMAAYVGYDDRNLYVAVRVIDDKLYTDARATWYRDSIEVLWDPRPAGEQDGRFAGPCRQLIIAVPARTQPLKVTTIPSDDALAAAMRKACRKTADGYTIELAIPLSAVAKGFRPGPGSTLRLEIIANDRDGEDKRKTTSTTVLSGDSDANRNTAGYAIVRFE